MPRLPARLSLVLVLGLAASAVWTIPRGLESARALAARDDPAALADLGLDGRFSVASAGWEVEAALAANDPELANSFLVLARERGIGVNSSLADRVDADMRASSSAGGIALRFAKGFVTGEPDDAASFAGTAVGDLFVFGDIRDAAREGTRLFRGEEPNHLLLGLSLGGLAVTAGTYASVGLTAPARAGLSLIKVAGKTELAGARLARMIRLERPAALVQFAGDVGRVQAKAGTRAALDGLRLAGAPKDMARMAVLAAAKGGKTRAVLKLFGRGAIVLARSAIDLALGVFWAIANLIGFCGSLKRAAERTTLSIIRRRKLRRLKHEALAACARSP